MVMWIFFGVSVAAPRLIFFGLTLDFIGLVDFIDALWVMVMRLGEKLGTEPSSSWGFSDHVLSWHPRQSTRKQLLLPFVSWRRSTLKLHHSCIAY